MNTVEFKQNEKLGAEAVAVVSKFLSNNKTKHRPATTSEQYNGIDLVTNTQTYEVKHQTYDDKIVIEEDSMSLKDGWIYTSQAQYLIEVSADRKRIYKIDMQKLRSLYTKIWSNYSKYVNDETDGVRGDKWCSTYRVIPLADIKQYIDIKEYKL
jgi:hypothetical protein